MPLTAPLRNIKTRRDSSVVGGFVGNAHARRACNSCCSPKCRCRFHTSPSVEEIGRRVIPMTTSLDDGLRTPSASLIKRQLTG
ncbi:uncharacterized protein Dana_GF28126 [Drosophila ananassae]|uniref:Uncharacterized protein n=1 Tax=Drosophila ananassae TaxID=7217 RepID=A0A0P8XUD2_DROAN|nr:uncharacterized protein Dana_GF28126 [Drosophila ananassae]